MDVSHNFSRRITPHLLTFWHFDTRNGFSVRGSGRGGSRGGTRGGADSPLFLDQIEDRRAKKFFLRPPPPPLISGCGWFPPYLKVFIRHQEPITRRHWVGWLNSDLKYWLQVLPSSPPADFQPFTLISLLTRFSARPHWPHMSRRKTLLKNLAYRNVVI